MKKPIWKQYDIIAIDEELLSPKVVENIKVLKTKKELKVVGLNSLLRTKKSTPYGDVIDMQLIKPLNQGRVFDLIVDLYRIDINQAQIETESEVESEDSKAETKTIQIYKEPIPEAKNISREQFANFDGVKLLIVEDNLINQKVLTTILDQSGIDISIANNGEEALLMVTDDKVVYDMVLMDINMPVMDGYTATAYIRAIGKFSDLPIVAFTALVLESEVQKMFNAGMNAFLSKPLNIGKLYTAFDMFIGANQSEKPVDKQPSKVAIKLDEIDIKEGIRYANGDEALYVEVLKEFIEYYGETGELLQTLILEHRFEQIKMICLDMKGLTGAIGAHDMFAKVDEIHKLFIYGNQHLLPKYLEGYQQELDKLIKAIHIYLGSDQADHSV
ncbi:MAG: hypothetical protein DRG30_01115 [Epsilonproteobacteria bacterium]|nr:MAG: hypothetical protein DRG30_01115 [Campylobacterota bacterium]